ncbi:MAG: hypothetical protein OEP48_04175 [Betaproteobacteria bacterium]|nr:hypothetical protein [Betaproteobacteria bacterium]MDH3437704.1 hypothetical protein [Betaproteobacteria bacterium]
MAAVVRQAQKVRADTTVGADERRHLIEACAFFRADHFRPAEPGCYRQQDLKEAAAEIDAILKRGGRKGKGMKR